MGTSDDESTTVGATEGGPASIASSGGGALATDNYELGEVLGSGGMGEVVLARDRKINRVVALKRMRADAPSSASIGRFLREAKIQARLEHPAIVPVHELAFDADGRPYFTMKRLAGKTLREILDDPHVKQQRLLRALVDVCRAIELAHAQGVVHRDLKPTNIMLGDYGEVYVLDWGIARVLDETTSDLVDTGPLTEGTQVGSLLGTPGYAAPEQVRGEPVGPAADVYSLGALLFEVLARQPLHPRGSMPAIESTLANPTAAPTDRGHQTPPELDALCVEALAESPAARPTVRELADRLQSFLDGDRDHERRRVLSQQALADARDLLVDRDPARRAEALRAAARALALDPESKEAAQIVTALMIEPPRGDLPPQLQSQLRFVEGELAVREARNAALSLCTYFLFIPFVIWVGVRDPLVVAGVFGYVAFLVAFNLWMSRNRLPYIVVPTLANIILALLLSRLFSPLLVVPAIIVSYSVVTAQLSMSIDRPWLVLGAGVISLLLPFALEATGVLAPTWSIASGVVTIHGTALELDGTRAAIYIVSSYVAVLVATTLYGRLLAVKRRNAQQRLAIQAWHLRQLFPVEAPTQFVSGPSFARPA